MPSNTPNQTPKGGYSGPVPPGADEKTFRRTGETNFVSSPSSGPTNIAGSRGERYSRGGGGGGPGKNNSQAEEQARVQALMLQQAQQNARAQAEQRKAETFRNLLAKNKAQEQKKSITSNVASGLRSPPRVFRTTREVIRQKAEQELAKPTNFFGARGDVAKKNLQSAELSKIVGDREIKLKVGFPTMGAGTTINTGVNISTVEKAGGLIFPETKGQALGLATKTATFVSLPAIVRSAVGFYIASQQARVLDAGGGSAEESLLRKTLFFGGIGGGSLDVLPFVKGKIATVRGATEPTVTQTPKDVISQKLFGSSRESVQVQTVKGQLDIGFIPEGRGFGFSQQEQLSLIKKPVTITTSQANIPIKNGFVEFGPGSEGMGAFFSPTMQGSGGGARISRLGLAESSLKLTPLNAELGLGTSNPRIFFAENIKAKNIGYKGSGELETTISPGAYPIGSPKSVILKSQKVDVFEITGGLPGPKLATGSVKSSSSSSIGPVKVSPLSSITGVVRPIQTPIINSVTFGPFQRGTVSNSSIKVSNNTISSLNVSPPKSPSPINYSRERGSQNTIRNIPPPRLNDSPSLPPIRPSYPTRNPTPRRGTPRIQRLSSFPPSFPGTPLKTIRPLISKKKRGRRPFLVEVRKGGIFKPIGRTQTAFGASQLLKRSVGSTISASGRISGGKAPLLQGFRLPKAGSKLGKGQIFVEKRQFRLSKAGEIRDIQIAKRKKVRR